MTYEGYMDVNILDNVSLLINNKKFTDAEKTLNTITNKTSEWYYLFSKIMLSKSWFDAAKSNLETAISLNPNNQSYKDDLISLMSRHRRYSDDYYRGGYRRRRGCACCCCDDCCCDCDISCCDLICLDQMCECMGGDLIDCI